MTSNIGTGAIDQQNRIGFGSQGDAVKKYDKFKDNISESLKRRFRPEFLNRIDDIVIFHKLEQEHIDEIVVLMLANVAKKLAEREIKITFTKDAEKYLADMGFDAEYGARPLKRVIQREVEDKLSEDIVSGKIKLGDTVAMCMKDGKPVFKKK